MSSPGSDNAWLIIHISINLIFYLYIVSIFVVFPISSLTLSIQ